MDAPFNPCLSSKSAIIRRSDGPKLIAPPPKHIRPPPRHIRPPSRVVVPPPRTTRPNQVEIESCPTIPAKETGTWKDGKEYPLVKMDISSASHPFYTGKQRIADSEGRAEKFKKKFGARHAMKPQS